MATIRQAPGGLVRAWAAIAVVLLSLNDCAASSQAQTGVVADPAALSGIVTDGISGQPISGAVVSLEPLSRSTLSGAYHQTTDSQGRFAFRDVPPLASYRLAASRFGYFAGGFGSDGPLMPIERLSLSSGEWRKNVSIRLWRPASIAGTITDEGGEPAVGVYVRVLLVLPLDGQSRLAVGPVARTDDRGRYATENLPGGEYLVMLPAAGATGASEELAASLLRTEGTLADGGRLGTLPLVVHRPLPTSTDRLPRTYPLFYYPGVRHLADAVPVRVALGEHREGVDMRLQPTAAWRVPGRIEGPSDTVRGLVLRLIPQSHEGLGVGSEAANSTVAADGRFTFVDVPSGNYTIVTSPGVSWLALMVSPASFAGLSTRLPSTSGTSPSAFHAVMAGPGAGVWYSTHVSAGRPGVWVSTPVTVKEEHIEDLVVRAGPTITVSGTIELSDSRSTRPTALLVSAEPWGEDVALGCADTMVSANQGRPAFRLEGLLPGQYYLNVAAVGPGPTVVRSITWQGQDYADFPLDARGGTDISDVVVTLTTKIARIGGTVRDARLAPARDATVLAYPVDRRMWGGFLARPRRMPVVVTDQTGGFSFGVLPAGNYYVVATSEVPGAGWRSLSFLEVASSVATAVHVDWGETKTVDLRLRTIGVR